MHLPILSVAYAWLPINTNILSEHLPNEWHRVVLGQEQFVPALTSLLSFCFSSIIFFFHSNITHSPTYPANIVSLRYTLLELSQHLSSHVNTILPASHVTHPTSVNHHACHHLPLGSRGLASLCSSFSLWLFRCCIYSTHHSGHSARSPLDSRVGKSSIR